jgi:ABC-2 type transport system ATP-binding protein
MSAAAIEVRGLHRSYGDLEAVRGIDLTVDAGEVFALLGPNGAGKTTTVEILEGYRSPTAGEVRVLGRDPGRRDAGLRARVGIVLQSAGVDPYLTVRETVELYAGYYPHPRGVDDVIGLVGLSEKRDTRVLKLSGGLQRRLDVAVALAGDPELLFLDEPTTGFDPGARRSAWGVVRALAALGKTIFLTTHYMDEAQALADRVAVISKGEIVAEGRPEVLIDRHRSDATIRFGLPPDADPPTSFAGFALGDGRFEIVTADPTGELHRLTGWALDHDLELRGLEVTKPTLEDVYLELTGADTGER